MTTFSEQLRDDLFRAYFDARKNKRNTTSQLRFEMDAETQLLELRDRLLDRTYKPQPAVCFMTHYPVDREVFASQFCDRVVHHLLYAYIAPVFERSFIYDSYSCRVGKGTRFGIERLEHHIRSCSDNYIRTAYVLKLDIRGYFMSIDRQLLYHIICKRLDKHWRQADVCSEEPGKNPEFVDFLIRSILFRDPTRNCIVKGSPREWDKLPASKSLFRQPPGIGLPIGDLTSQLFSNIYLGEFDNFVKRVLQVKHYGRYVDDFFVVHASKHYLMQLIPHMKEFLQTELHLQLHPRKFSLQLHTQGVHFLGAFVKPHRRYVVCRTLVNFRHTMDWVDRQCRVVHLSKRRLANVRSRINSGCGYLAAFRTHDVRKQMVAGNALFRHFYFVRQLTLVRVHNRYKRLYRRFRDLEQDMMYMLSV